MIYAVFYHAWIVVIASAVIMLAWLKDKERRKKESQKIDDLPVLAACRSGTLAIYSSVKLMVPLPMEALDNAWYGSWRPLTNLTQTIWVCHLCTFNVAVIFFRTIPTYGVLLYHDSICSNWFSINSKWVMWQSYNSLTSTCTCGFKGFLSPVIGSARTFSYMWGNEIGNASSISLTLTL